MTFMAMRLPARAPAALATVAMAAALAGASPARADQLRLDNGDRLTGKVAGIDGGKLVFETAAFGKATIPVARIASVTTDDVVTIEFVEGGFATGRLSSPGGGVVRLSGPGGTTSEFRLAAVKAIHPGSKIPVRAFKWTGQVNVGISNTSGNTDTSAYHVDAEAKGRGSKDRITMSAALDRETTDGAKSTDNSRVAAQYDRFVSKRWFVFLQGSAERDKFEDLNLRTTIGPGAGYQIIDTDRMHLSIEGGPTYVNEDLDTAPDRDFLTGRWSIKFDTFVFNKFAQLFHNHEGLIDFGNAGDILIRSKQGARIPVRDSLNVTAQINWDYDNEPAPGNKKSDTKYLLTVGYTW